MNVFPEQLYCMYQTEWQPVQSSHLELLQLQTDLTSRASVNNSTACFDPDSAPHFDNIMKVTTKISTSEVLMTITAQICYNLSATSYDTMRQQIIG